jgi:mono/diheme cytochrome c family protein
MRVRLAIIIIILTLVLAACTSPHQLPEAPTPIPRLVPATLPPSEAQPTPPPSGTEPMATPSGDGEPAGAGDAAQGQQVFDANCSVCHTLTDEPKVGPGLAGLYAEQAQLPNGQPFSDENMREWIRNGGGAMPGIPLGDEELTDLLAYLQQETQ